MKADTYPHPTSAAVTAAMKGNRRTDTKPEVAVRSILHRRRMRFRKDRRVGDSVKVKADIVFVSARVAVFIDGCFWHGCPEHGNTPRANTHYWGPKLERNRRRDRLVVESLTNEGWRVVRIWEHVPPEEAASHIERTVKAVVASP